MSSVRADRLDPETGRRRYRTALLSGTKGRAKSELTGMLACAEALGPVRFEFGPQLRARSTAQRPMAWLTNRPKPMEDAHERSTGPPFRGTATPGAHCSPASTLDGGWAGWASRSARNTPSSPRKIDAAMAAVLADEARADAVAPGLNRERRPQRTYAF
jgi:hypothetical protein